VAGCPDDADAGAAPLVIRAIAALYRDAFGGLPRRTWLLCAAAFLNRCGSMVVPFLGPYLKREFHFTPGEAGLVVGLYGIGAFLGSWLGGVLTDRIGPVRLQVVALSSSALWMLLMTQLHRAEFVVPAVFVLGILNDSFRPGSNTAAAISVPPELRRKALSLNRFALNLGWAFGPTIGGYLVVEDFTWMFVVDGATCGLAALWLWYALRGWNPLPPPPPPTTATTRPQRPLTDPHFLALMGANLCALLAFMQYFTTAPRVLVDQGHSEAVIGWLLAINPILIVLFEMPVVHGLRARAALPTIALGSLLIGAGYLCMLLPFGLGAMVLAMVVIAGGELLQMPLLGAYVNDHTPDHARGAYNGAYGMTFTLALVLAPVLGGYVYGKFGAMVLWWWCAALGAIAAGWFAWLGRRALARHP
jgi:predicted MFS family arabinose efflux permease